MQHHCPWDEYLTIAVNRNLSNCEIARKKFFRASNGIWTRGLCVRAAVLYQLSYEDPYTGKQANLLSSSTHERMNAMNKGPLPVFKVICHVMRSKSRICRFKYRTEVFIFEICASSVYHTPFMAEMGFCLGINHYPIKLSQFAFFPVLLNFPLIYQIQNDLQ